MCLTVSIFLFLIKAIFFDKEKKNDELEKELAKKDDGNDLSSN